jgi:hypothetical protein
MSKRFLLNLMLMVFILTSWVKNGYGQTPVKQTLYLSGTDNAHTKSWDFWCSAGRKSGYWTKIQIPSCWEQQGFGAYNFGRDNVNYGKNFRFADEKGIYKYQFEVPAGWKGKTVNLVFEGSMTDTEVKINGQQAGPIHQGAFYRFKYDITGKINFKRPNQLQVGVSKMSADASVNNAERLADYWIFGGIFRPVYLECVPKEYITHTAIDAKADGSFAINVFLKNAAAGRHILAEILDEKGNVVKAVKGITHQSDSVLCLKTTYPKAHLWTAETPNLYTVRTSIQTAGKTIYETKNKFGFRTIEVRKHDGIYVNGKKIKLKGINRHVWWPETGRTVSADIDIADVKLIKGMNMNAVRCSHYPPDQSFLSACDSLGLYVLDELAGWQKAYSTKAGRPLVKEMVIRDCNHPSIIFWSNGNEGGHNFELDKDFAKYDLSARTVIHAHHQPGNAINGIDCNHYENYTSTKRILADTNIYMPTEFLHALDDGGGAAGLSDLWDLHWNTRNGAGGFIWALLDEGIVRTDMQNQIDVNGVNGPDGVVGPHREKEGSYNAIKEIYCPVKITLKNLPEDFAGAIPVENRYNFTNLNQCKYKWELVKFNNPADMAPGYTITNKGIAVSASVLPFEKGNLKLNLPADWKENQALLLTAYDRYGDELYKWSWKIQTNQQLLKTLVKTAGTNFVEMQETDSILTLKSSGISVSISKKTGFLNKLANDYSKPLPFSNGPSLVTGSSTLSGIKHYRTNDGYVVEVAYKGDLKTVKWKMYPSGWLELFYEYSLDGDYPFAGVSFSYPQNYVFKVKWLGDGQYRVWKNRPFGTMLNVWEKLNNNTQTGRSPWIYPEFKGYFSNMVWLELTTVAGKFTIASKDEDLFVRLFNFHGLAGPEPSPGLPKGDISFLDAIPPVGSNLGFNTKYNPAGLGPMSALNAIHGTKQRTLYFYFGSPKIE